MAGETPLLNDRAFSFNKRAASHLDFIHQKLLSGVTQRLGKAF